MSLASQMDFFLGILYSNKNWSQASLEVSPDFGGESWVPYLQLQDLDPIHLEADLELRLRHVAGGSGYGQSTSSGSCAAAQLVQLPKEPSLGTSKPGRSMGKHHFLDL